MTSHYTPTLRALNDATRKSAINEGSNWCDEEIELIMEWDGHDEDELTAAALLLGRSREACRQRYYKVLREGHRETQERSSRVISRTRRSPVTYTYSNWAPEDRSEWYK